MKEQRRAQALRSVVQLVAELADWDGRSQSAAVEGIVAFVRTSGLENLLQLDAALRAATLRAYRWQSLDIRHIEKRPWPLPVWGVFTMHPNGYVRESALRRIVEVEPDGLFLPFLLLRLNDWVEPVRLYALGAVRRLLSIQHVRLWPPLLGSVTVLQSRHRADHSWLNDELMNLFLRPSSRGELERALRSENRGTCRWAMTAALRLPPEERSRFLRIALTNVQDDVARLVAAKHVRNWTACPDRDELISAMECDPSMPIRREALYAILDAPAARRRQSLGEAIFDQHSSIRHAARFYLKQHDPTFDARPLYLEALRRWDGAEIRDLVAGLGECGTREDADVLASYADDSSPRAAAAAVRAVAALDLDGRVQWFQSMIRDQRACVSREAARALRPIAVRLDVDDLRRALVDSPFAHARRWAIELLLRRGCVNALPDAIKASIHPDQRVAARAMGFLATPAAGSIRQAPSRDQLAAIKTALAAIPGPMRPVTRTFVERIVGGLDS